MITMILTRLFRFLSLLYLILLIFCIENTLSIHKPRLLIISLDGFAHKYLEMYSLPTINRIQNQGIKTKYGMQPTFTTMTFPNHMSLATGLYEEDHGIIHNKFYDTKLRKEITFGNRDDGQWNDPKIEPIWITATRQNVNSAVLYWPASHNEFHGIRPLFYTSIYSDSIPIREKINDAIAFFKQTSIQLVMLYHPEPDKQGHQYGPDAKETYDTLLRLDDELNYLLTRVKKELDDNLNIIILSDHGMTTTKQVIQPFLHGYINESIVYRNVLDGSLFSVVPRKGKFQTVFNGLSLIPNVTVYTRKTFPKHYHYVKAYNRVGEIFVLPNSEHMYFSKANTAAHFPKGSHGYDNTLPSMQAIFMAMGPDFNEKIEIDSLKNVDVYHIVCKILSLKPNPHATAGSLNNLTDIFRTRPTLPERITTTRNNSFQSSIDFFLELVLLGFTLIRNI